MYAGIFCMIFAFNFLIRTKYLYRRMRLELFFLCFSPHFSLSLSPSHTYKHIRTHTFFSSHRPIVACHCSGAKHDGMQLKRLVVRGIHWLMMLLFFKPFPRLLPYELTPYHSNDCDKSSFRLRVMHTHMHMDTSTYRPDGL